MKLFHCKNCGDVRSLRIDKIVFSTCEKTCGKYDEDGLNAWVAGPCHILGIANYSKSHADLMNVTAPPQEGENGFKFDAFVIPEAAPTIRRSTWKHEVALSLKFE